MKIKIVLTGLALLTLAGCQSNATIPESATQCPEERPQMCTMDYMPACGYLSATEYKTYSNACSACSDPQVKAVAANACPK